MILWWQTRLRVIRFPKLSKHLKLHPICFLHSMHLFSNGYCVMWILHRNVSQVDIDHNFMHSLTPEVRPNQDLSAFGHRSLTVNQTCYFILIRSVHVQQCCKNNSLEHRRTLQLMIEKEQSSDTQTQAVCSPAWLTPCSLSMRASFHLDQRCNEAECPRIYFPILYVHLAHWCGGSTFLTHWIDLRAKINKKSQETKVTNVKESFIGEWKSRKLRRCIARHVSPTLIRWTGMNNQTKTHLEGKRDLFIPALHLMRAGETCRAI